MAARLVVAAVFVLVPRSSVGQSEISAGRSQTTRTGNTAERVYADSVRAQFGDVRIEADSARVRSGADTYVFVRGVRLVEGNRRIQAARLTFDTRDSTARFEGDVEIEGTERSVRADRLTFDLGTEQLKADGNVRVSALKRAVVLMGEAWHYDTAADSGSMKGHVRVTRIRDQDTLEISAPRAVVDRSADSVRFEGPVVVRLDGYSGASAWLGLAPERRVMTLVGSAELAWSHGAGSADTLGVVDDTGGAKRIQALGAGRLRAHDDDTTIFLEAPDYSLEITRSGEPRNLNAVGGCVLRMVGRDSTEAEAVTAHVLFVRGSVSELTMENGTVRHAGAGKEYVVSGDGIKARFDSGRIQALTADSNATFENATDGTRIRSDRIEAIFEEGVLTTATAHGRVEGDVEGRER